MPGVSLSQLGQAKPVAGYLAGSANFWSPGNIKEIIGGMESLLRLYMQAKNGGVTNDVMDSSRELRSAPIQDRPPPQPGITMPEIMKLGKQFCINLEAQGHGNSTILEVLQKVPLTISQIKDLIPS